MKEELENEGLGNSQQKWEEQTRENHWRKM
jgi:hypothetical protein